MLFSNFKLCICRLSFGLLEFSVFLRPPRLQVASISCLHKCHRKMLHKCFSAQTNFAHFSKMHKTKLNALPYIQLHSTNTIAQICRQHIATMLNSFWSNSNFQLLFVTVAKKKGRYSVAKRIYKLGRLPRRQEQKGKTKQ